MLSLAPQLKAQSVSITTALEGYNTNAAYRHYIELIDQNLARISVKRALTTLEVSS